MTQTEDLISQINEKNDRSEYRAALDVALGALKDFPDDYALWIAAGNAYYGLRQFDLAKKNYLKAADLEPDDVVSLSNLAGICFEENRFEEGLKACDEALKRKDGYLNVYIHQGNLLSSLNRYEEALTSYEKALSIAPDDELVLFNTAYAQTMTNQPDKASKTYERLLEKEPQNTEYLFAYAAFSEQTEQFEKAGETYLKLLQIEDTPATHIILSGCLYNLQLLNKTESVWRLTDAWLAAFPDNPVARHVLETLKESKDVKRASAEYVGELFDAFADSFDSVLEGLNYQAPSLVAQAVKKLNFPTLPDVLDLGCGTGLCAQALKKNGFKWHSITGIDLSAQMLKKARDRRLYSKLIQSDIVSFLPYRQGMYDLIISADVFTYLGDLSDLFKSLASSLKPKGTAVFTVSENREESSGYALEPSGRFMHGRDYLVSLLEKSNLAIKEITSVELRQELGKSVYGLLAVCCKI